MLREVGVEDVDELYAAIPERLRFGRLLDLPPALQSEVELRRYLEGLLGRNTSSCAGTLSFLGRRLLAARRAGGRATRS